MSADTQAALVSALKAMLENHGSLLHKGKFENCNCLGCFEARQALALVEPKP